MNEIYIHHHLGLGDHIICSGIVRQFSKIYRNVFLFCKQNNILNVSFLYRDLQNVTLVPISNDYDVYNNFKHKDILQIGFGNVNEITQKYNVGWDESFYKQINIPFKERWDSFYILRDFKREDKLYDKLNPNNKKFALVHSSGSDGVNRIDYLKLIELSDEIHCIDSSFIHLIDSVKTNGKLFYHKNVKVRNVSESHTQIKKWNII
jgi:hypothetical protein